MTARIFERIFPCAVLSGLLLSFAGMPALAQETDVTQTPNLADAGIKKSLEDQIGAGRGDILTPNSSSFLIARDPFRAIVRGRQLFQRKFTVAQGNGPRAGDGVGDIMTNAAHGAGLADSCAACHARPRGSAGFGGDVFTRPDSRDAPHLFGLGLVEMLADEITSDLRKMRTQVLQLADITGVPVTATLSSKGISFGVLVANPDQTLDTSGVVGVDGDLRVRPFFAEGSTFSMRDFIVGAFNAEMGMQAPDPDLMAAAAGGSVVTPSGLVLDGALDTFDPPPADSEMHDPDNDGVTNEIPTSLVDHMEFYLLNYFKPGIGFESALTGTGRQIFEDIGCVRCHIPDLILDDDRRVADVETNYDDEQGGFNNLFATAAAFFNEVDDGSGFPSIKVPSNDRFVVENIFTDFKRHDLGPAFHERNFDGTLTTEFVTEPLWGVGSTAPYGHDGRSINLREVILRHGGEAQVESDAFKALGERKKILVELFLQTLVLFPPPDTASVLNEADPSVPGYPQFGHGSIDLSVLFNDPNDKE